MAAHSEPNYRFDAATEINQGARDYQEDAIASDFGDKSGLGFVVLADGMGGHAAGDIASKIVVTEMSEQLAHLLGNAKMFCTHAPYLLRKAVESANECLKHYSATNPGSKGMGSTLISMVMVENELYWVSVGDSPLYLFRDKSLTRLNENHSMSESIDLMVQTGILSEEEGRDHPDRSVLTSAMVGQSIPRIDCPDTPIQMCPGDILIVASDGLQFLDDTQITSVLRENSQRDSSDIAESLMSSVIALNDPDLDNVSFSIVQIDSSGHETAAQKPNNSRLVTRPLGPQLPSPANQFVAPTSSKRVAELRTK